MKVLITYSSLTGNTKSVAEAIAQTCPYDVELCPVKEAVEKTVEELKTYALIAIGYWVDKGDADKKCISLIEKISDQKIAFFGTLGAYPDSDHAKNCKKKIEDRAGDNKVLGHFLCQGRIDPKILEMMAKHASPAHPMTDERKARIEEAKKHPNEDDFKNAQTIYNDIYTILGQ